jgi:hypothetical protein
LDEAALEPSGLFLALFIAADTGSAIKNMKGVPVP